MSSLNDDIQEGFKMTELGPLPDEWEVVPIDDLAFVASGGSAPQGDHCFISGNNPFVRVQHIEQDADRITEWNLITDQAVHDYGLRLFPKGTIVFPKSGASIYLEKRAVLPIDAYIVSHLCALSPKTEIVDGSFLFHVLRYIRFAELKAEGYPTLNLSEIKVTRLPLPPLPEQKAIARVLSSIQKAVEAQDKIITAARELKKSLIRHLFTYGPVPVSEAGQVPIKETEIGPVPEYWEVVRLGEVVQKKEGIKRGPWGGSIKKEIFVPTGYKVYEQQNVIANDFSIGSYFIDGDKFEELNDFAVKDGDILITAAGTLGKLAIVPENAHKGIINQALLRLRLNEDIIAKLYFKNAFNNLVDNRILEGMSHGATLKNLSSVAVLKNLPLPPQTEQQEIVRVLSTVDNKIEAEEDRKASLQALSKTMLHLLMTGKVRVTELEATAA